jgi:hypothetical protein
LLRSLLSFLFSPLLFLAPTVSAPTVSPHFFSMMLKCNGWWSVDAGKTLDG